MFFKTILSPVILQAKLDNLLGDIKGLKTYIDDILGLIKDILYNPIEQLGIIFGRLRTAGLKFNACKCSFGLKGVPYLGYVITWEVIKTDSNKVQGVMDIVLSTTITEV